MRMQVSRIKLLSGVLLGIILLPQSISAASFDSDEGIRIELARESHVNINNRYGSISLEVWGESFAYVAAAVEGNTKTLVTSPIVIDNRNKTVSISVVRRPIDPVATIDLIVRIPESTHLQAETVNAGIVLRGMSRSAVLRSISGEIRASLPPNTEINAKSGTGRVKSDLTETTSGDEHSLLRRGPADRTLRISSDSGAIILTPLDSSAVATARRTGPPELTDTSRSQAAGTPATSSENEDIGEGDVVRVDSQLVTLNLSVIDRNTNRGLTGLTQSDFKMFEDGVEQRIVQFDASSAPFDLVLLIDLSGSTKDVLKLIREAALRFVDAARASDRIAVVTFAGKPALVSKLTLDRAALRGAINNIETAAGDTKLYDSIDFTLNEISRQNTKSRRTAIVLMSDGLDGSIPGVQGDGSKLPYNQLLAQIQEFDGVLYTLWLNTEYEAMNPQDTQPEAFEAGYDRMKELADTGGGIFYEVERLENLAGAYERVVADLGTVYSLAYRPENKTRDKHWRAIRVNVNRPNAVARGKRGYYAN